MKHRLAFPAGLVLLLVSLVLLAIQCTPDGQASSSASEDIQPDSDIPGDPPTPSPSEEIQSAPDTPGDLATPPPPEGIQPHPNALGPVYIPDQVHYYQSLEPRNLLFARFFPIGWSTDGKLAYLNQPADEAMGCLFLSLVVQDMVSDSILRDRGYDGCQEDLDFETLWATRLQPHLSEIESEFGIVQGQEFELGDYFFTHQDRFYEIQLEAESTDSDEMMGPSITSARLTVSSPELGQKEVYGFSMEGYSGILSVDIAGHLMSPQGNRIAIVYTEVHRGWEGPPHVLTYRLVGAHLTSGFRRTVY